MNEYRRNFNSWFKDILATLYSNREAGFVILMVVFPLLERYLREKSGVHEDSLNDSFYNELCRLFPLNTKETASQFWQVYRNGLLHQVTLSQRSRKGIQMPDGWVSSDVDILSIDNNGNFWVHPAKFAQRVVQAIEDDFATFEGGHSANHPLPKVYQFNLFAGTSAADPTVYEATKTRKD